MPGWIRDFTTFFAFISDSLDLFFFFIVLQAIFVILLVNIMVIKFLKLTAHIEHQRQKVVIHKSYFGMFYTIGEIIFTSFQYGLQLWL